MTDYPDLDLAALLGRLNPSTYTCLEEAGGWAFNRTHYEVAPAHVLAKMIEDRGSDVPAILTHYGIDPGRLTRDLESSLERLRTGSGGELQYSPTLTQWITDAWLLTSIEFGEQRIRSGTLLLAAVQNKGRYLAKEVTDRLSPISFEKLKEQLRASSVESSEDATAAGLSTAEGEGTSAEQAGGTQTSGDFLGKYCRDLTEAARSGKIDPVFGRDREIRSLLDILARRRKNNPIVVGDPGVGKTAVVEGLALRIVEGDVPDVVAGVKLMELDLGLLQAGASVKGEFEKRLQGVIDDVKGSPTPVVLFIDEAHTLIGAGGAAGGSDAANLLKPALARGELRTIAATTWKEYKKYFEKDPALTRRFQLVGLDEPDDAVAALILRGLRAAYEESHDVLILDDAVEAAANLGGRYISGRSHPDKSVDLLDTAAARVRIAQKAKPPVLDDLERRVAARQRELDARERDKECGVNVDEDVLQALRDELGGLRDQSATVEATWREERDRAAEVVALRKEHQAAKAGEGDRDVATIEPELNAALTRLAEVQEEDPMVPVQVDRKAIASVVSDWTGIPLGNMVRDEAETLLNFEDLVKKNIKGQDYAVERIATGVRQAKAGIENPQTPNGVFLLVGPSGVGKTEMAMTVSELLYGGRDSVVTINMTEFMESHNLSRLVGSPPGYVGYGEGGVLTEAVRKRPYSLVLFDEVEKADKQVANIFYQIFDKGMLADGEGRVIDFKNTTIFLTSNLGTDVFHDRFEDVENIDMEEVVEAIRPSLRSYFAPALLGRMSVVPFLPLGQEVLKDIVELKLGKVADRLRGTHRVELVHDPEVIQRIAERCTEVESGARNVDHILSSHLNPKVAEGVLRQMQAGEMPSQARVTWNEDAGEFAVEFSGERRKLS